MTARGIAAYPKRSIMAGLGMSFSVVLLITGLFWNDSMNYLVLAQYSFIQKETGSIELTHSMSSSSVRSVSKIDGILEAEGYRYVPVKVIHQLNEENSVIKGIPDNPKLQGMINIELDEIKLPEGGMYISRILADMLKVKEGDTLDIEVLEGSKPRFSLKIEKIVDTLMSAELITSRKNLSKLMKTDDLVNRILFRSLGNTEELYTKLKEMPTVMTVTYRDSALKMFNETSASFILVFAFILSIFSAAIGFGIAYNNMRVTLSERDWEMATLQILGFTKPEVFRILVSEIFTLLPLFAPLGCVLGYWISKALLDAMSMEAFQIPFVIEPLTYLISMGILAFAVILSSYFVYRMLKKEELVATLKSRG
jgi:putative ABC transport system permease protein